MLNIEQTVMSAPMSYVTSHLIGQPMERSSEAIHSPGKADVGVREGATDQVGGVGTHITPLVVTETKQLYTVSRTGIII